ncbi:protein of unknown function [Cupriavidus taiwanensis]|nr:protein of unknown function [Cupriavidus taiwanensis]
MLVPQEAAENLKCFTIHAVEIIHCEVPLRDGLASTTFLNELLESCVITGAIQHSRQPSIIEGCSRQTCFVLEKLVQSDLKGVEVVGNYGRAIHEAIPLLPNAKRPVGRLSLLGRVCISTDSS